MAFGSDWFEIVRTRLTIGIDPCKWTTVGSAFQSHLKDMLLKYSEVLDGVPLVCRNITLDDNEAVVHPYFPFLQVSGQAEFLLFKPRKGMKLVGVVERIAHDILGVLVLGFVHAVLAIKDISGKLKLDSANGVWRHKTDDDYIIRCNTPVVFTVEGLVFQRGFFRITGSMRNLKEEGLYSRVLERIKEKREKKDKKKRKQDEGKEELPENEKIPKKKRKKENGSAKSTARKKAKESKDSTSQNGSPKSTPLLSSSKKKSKKVKVRVKLEGSCKEAGQNGESTKKKEKRKKEKKRVDEKPS